MKTQLAEAAAPPPPEPTVATALFNHEHLRGALWALFFKRLVKEMGWRWPEYMKRQPGRELYRKPYR
jgi:hypothetical protein